MTLKIFNLVDQPLEDDKELTLNTQKVQESIVYPFIYEPIAC